jgi:transcriptional regulator with XRE-family HTH domain
VIGDVVRGWRLDRGWTQTDVVRRSRGRLTQTYLSKLEGGGIATPTRPMMEALAAVFEKPVADLYRAAGVLEGIEEHPANGQVVPPALPTSPARDADSVPIAQKVADVEARRGEHYQRRLAAARERMSREEYERFCSLLWGMWEGNSLMVFNLLGGEGGTE